MIENRVSRWMGGIWILTSLLWVALSIAGLIYGLRWLENTRQGLDQNLDLIATSLGSVEEIIAETTNVISATYQSLETVSTSTADAATAITDMRPLIGKTNKVLTEDVPAALDGVQDSMPALIQTAKTVDETLTWIANFKIVIPIPFTSGFVFDFGVDYNPLIPLDQSLEEISGSLEGVPDDLRSMEADLDNLDANLVIVRDDLAQLSDDIAALNQQIAAINPRLGDFRASLAALSLSFIDLQATLPNSFLTAQRIFTGIMILLLLTQIPSLYWGWMMATGAWFAKSSRKNS